MPEYLSPGVYIEDKPGNPTIDGVSSSTGGFMGMTQRGKVGKPIFITSWNAYLTSFANGMDSPFIPGSDLAYAIYGFFQNGGKRAYVIRVAGEKAACAKLVFAPPEGEETNPTMMIQAKDEGAWGNKLKIKIDKNDEVATNFDITVMLANEIVELFANLSNDTESETYWVDQLDFLSNFIEGISGELSILPETLLEGGDDGTTDLADNDFIKMITSFDVIDDVNLMCIPGQTSEIMTNALMSYVENRKDVFAILDAPKTSTVESVREFRKKISCKNAALNFPWIRVADPLSKTGKLRDCPTCGHVMGVYARIIQDRGVWKAPAGTEAIIRGAVDVTVKLTTGDTDVLNPAGIVSIMPKTNYGIVVWGARSISPDSSMKYISDILLDIMIKKSVFIGTQQFIFEPNDSITWTKVRTTVQSFLDSLWRDGGLFGETSAEAYFVKCDADLNPESVRNMGKLICEVGYASKKPAEFVIFRFSHSLSSN